ncbi:asparagine synthase-related protein [Streptomyces sp. AcH 505]|uniref:asparagine synthase-related protein n=1 Tax=Streptomyces sp. AcH 505 TaxID=352211 RepID=UPI0018E2D042
MTRLAGFLGGSSNPHAERFAAGMARLMAGNAQSLGFSQGAFAAAGATVPAIASDRGCIAVVDGIFYNGSELPGAGRGAAIQLIETYREAGFAGALKRINGDFAVALFDERDGALWLGRDRIGVRPLYYLAQDGSFAFASRPQALRALPGVSREVNARHVAVFAGSHYRYIDNVPDESPFAGIKQLPAASFVELRGQRLQVDRYWSLDQQPEWTENEATLAERYRELLREAVGSRLKAARKPVFTLSGGMDSSSVLACAVDIAGERLEAVSSVYADKTYDESDDIRGFVAEKVARWQPIPIEDFDLFDVVRQMVRAHDEPVATATWLSHFLLTRSVAEQGYDVVFGGLGGDELNAGEYEYFVFNFADLRHRGLHADLEHEIATWAQHHDHPIYRKHRDAAMSHLTRLAGEGAGEVLVDRERMNRYFPAVQSSYYDLHGFRPVLDHPFSSWLKNRTYQDIFRETAPCCLRAEDRNCASAGLGHADPFFDHRLVEFMFRVPGAMKIRDGVTKRLLREAMKGILPEETRTRIKKTGWNAPAHIWFNGPAVDQLLDLVHSRVFRERGVYDVAEVVRLIEEHRSIVNSGAAKDNHMMFLWQLLNVELWFQEVVDHVPELAAA